MLYEDPGHDQPSQSCFDDVDRSLTHNEAQAAAGPMSLGEATKIPSGKAQHEFEQEGQPAGGSAQQPTQLKDEPRDPGEKSKMVGTVDQKESKRAHSESSKRDDYRDI